MWFPSLIKSFKSISESSAFHENEKPSFWFRDISIRFLYFLGWVLIFRAFALTYMNNGLNLNASMAYVAAAIVFAARLWVLKSKSHEKPLATFLFLEIFCLFFVASIEGGVNSSILNWLPVIPLVCFLMIPAFSFVIISLCLGLLFCLILSPSFFGLTAGVESLVRSDWVFFLDLSCSIVSMAYLALIYERKTWNLIEKVQQAKDDLNVYKYAIEASSEGIVITNPRLKDNPIIYVNKAYENITGYSYEESVGKNCRFLQANPNAEDAQILRESIRSRSSVTVTLENKRKSGEFFFNRLTVSPVYENGELGYFVGVQRDVTKERSLSQIFEQSQRIAKMTGFVYRSNTDEVLWTSDVHGQGVTQSGKLLAFDEAFSFIGEEGQKEVQKAFQNSEKTRESFELNVLGLDKNGHKVYYVVRGEPDKDEREMVRIFGLVQNITEMVHIQNKIKSMILTLSDIVFILDSDGRYLEILCENEEDLIAPKEEIIGSKIDEYVEPSLAETFLTLVQDSIQNKKLSEIDYDLELEGERRYFSAKIASTDGEHAICTIKNITQERNISLELEKERRERAYRTKMTALGEMAGGIAHEINNPLTIIGGYASRLKRSLENFESGEMKKNAKYASRIAETVERIGSIILSMRRFARDGSQDPMKAVCFDEILEDTLELCDQRFKTMDVMFYVENKLNAETRILCREVEMGQVLLNLLNNSFDAIREVRKKEGPDTEHWIKVVCEETREGVVIKVMDSGPGVSQESRPFLFEPFYTSKGAGVGTGLGLSISQNIIQQHGGDLWYDDKEEHTSFAIKLKKAS